MMCFYLLDLQNILASNRMMMMKMIPPAPAPAPGYVDSKDVPINQTTTIMMMLNLPFELTTGLWLLAKGFRGDSETE